MSTCGPAAPPQRAAALAVAHCHVIDTIPYCIGETMQTRLLSLALILSTAVCGQSQTPIHATSPHVRVIAGNTCGSGTICGTDADGAWVLTNAHVAGTALGRAVNVDLSTPSQITRTTGHTRYSGYSSTRAVDYALLYVPALSIDEPQQLLRTEPKQIPFATTGSPRCVWPQVTKPFDDARLTNQGVLTGLPNAIGGQSGSSIYDRNNNAIALLTWSMNGRAAGQSTQMLYSVATSADVEIADRRLPGMQELNTAAPRPHTDEGIHATLAAAIQDLPIWTDGDAQPPQDCPDKQPDCTPSCCCCADQSQTAIQWAELLRAILELIRLLQSQAAPSPI